MVHISVATWTQSHVHQIWLTSVFSLSFCSTVLESCCVSVGLCFGLTLVQLLLSLTWTLCPGGAFVYLLKGFLLINPASLTALFPVYLITQLDKAPAWQLHLEAVSAAVQSHCWQKSLQGFGLQQNKNMLYVLILIIVVVHLIYLCSR